MNRTAKMVCIAVAAVVLVSLVVHATGAGSPLPLAPALPGSTLLHGGRVADYCLTPAVKAVYYPGPSRWSPARVLAHTRDAFANVLIVNTADLRSPGGVAVPGAAAGLTALHRKGYVVVFTLSPSGGEAPVYGATRRWLDTQGFEYDDLVEGADVVSATTAAADRHCGVKAGPRLCSLLAGTAWAEADMDLSAMSRRGYVNTTRRVTSWPAVAASLAVETLAPAFDHSSQCTTHACTEAGLTPAVIATTDAEHYKLSDNRLADCPHLARLPGNQFDASLPWDVLWAVKQTPACMRAPVCYQFRWGGRLCGERGNVDRCHRAGDAAPGASLEHVLATLPLQRHQAVNSIPGFIVETSAKRELCRKVRLVGTGFYPECFLLPEERPALDALPEERQKQHWIFKPDGNSNGLGITVHRGLHALPPRASGIVQRYVHNPLLNPEGFKLDVRVYGVIAGMDPLRIYLWPDSYVRVAGAKYRLDNLGNANAHVTNSIENTSYQRYTFTQLRALVARAGGDFDNVWRDMVQAVTKTVLAAAWTLGCKSVKHPYRCGDRRFQFLGVDLTISDTFDVTLLEINGDPSFKYRNEIISNDDSRMYKDLFDMLGFTEAGAFLGDASIAARITQFCGADDTCARRLQPHSDTLALMLAEHQHRGGYVLAFPPVDYRKQYGGAFAALLASSEHAVYPTPEHATLLDFFVAQIRNAVPDGPAGADATEQGM